MKFTVHGISPTTIEVPATTADGIAVTAQMPGFIIELVPVDPWQRSLTIVEKGATDEERAAVESTYIVDGTVEITAAAIA